MHEINIGSTIARKRRAAGLTQEDLAVQLGVTKAAVSKWELRQSMPDVVLLPRIAACFDMTLDDLFDYRPQLTDDECMQEYYRIAHLFATDAEAAYARMDELIADYRSCWTLLLYMASLYLFCAVRDRERADELFDRTLALIDRIETYSDDTKTALSAHFLRASVLQARGDFDGAIRIVEEAQPVLPAVTGGLLAALYNMKGDRARAVKLYQNETYYGVTNLMNCLSAQLDFYDGANKADRERIDALLRAADGVMQGFDIERMQPTLAMGFLPHAATVCLQAGDDARAAAYLERFITAISHYDLVQEMEAVKTSALFDKVEDTCGTPEAAQVMKAQLGDMGVVDMFKATVLESDAWKARAEDPQLGALLARLEAL